MPKPMLTVRLSKANHAQFKAACALLGTSMSDVLRSAIDATIAAAETEHQWWEAHDRAEAAEQGPVVVSFEVGGEEEEQ